MADLSGASWRKSSFSGGNNECIEVSLVPSLAAVRDSKNTAGGQLQFGEAGWGAFLAVTKTGGLTR